MVYTHTLLTYREAETTAFYPMVSQVVMIMIMMIITITIVITISIMILSLSHTRVKNMVLHSHVVDVQRSNEYSFLSDSKSVNDENDYDDSNDKDNDNNINNNTFIVSYEGEK